MLNVPTRCKSASIGCRALSGTKCYTCAAMGDFRKEHDLLGDREVPADAYYGVHTLRAAENFALSGLPLHPALVHAFADVKRACAQVNRRLGHIAPDVAEAIEQACTEMAAGNLNQAVIVDALQGGAGTSTNMNINEVLANRALEILGRARADYGSISPIDTVNLHQSTNDTYPTALRLAAIRELQSLETAVIGLQEAFQRKEREFAHVVKVARTQLQDAVLTTLGCEMGAYAEAFNRDRWRIYKCQERLRVVNLGGTAIGSGAGAPRDFIFQAVEALREITGIGLARAENLIEATQNADVFVEVSGILKAFAASLLKCAGDLRLLSSGPHAGLGELRLPELQAGSSIMPGKVNPVIPEAISQTAMLVMAHDHAITMAAALGNLELNPFLPLIAHLLLGDLTLLSRSARLFAERCVNGLQANEKFCARQVEGSTAALTALVPEIGYEKASELAEMMRSTGTSALQAALSKGYLNEERYLELTSPEALLRLGFVPCGDTQP